MTTAPDYAEVVRRFRSVAERFCAIVDDRSRLEKSELILQIYRVLPELIAEAVRLPDVVLNHPDEIDEGEEVATKQRPRLRKSHDGWKILFDSLRAKFGEDDRYREVFNPREDTEAIFGSLSDDIAGIYGDVAEWFIPLEGDDEKKEAIWHWRFGFYSHWGHHAIDALRTMHVIVGDPIVIDRP